MCYRSAFKRRLTPTPGNLSLFFLLTLLLLPAIPIQRATAQRTAPAASPAPLITMKMLRQKHPQKMLDRFGEPAIVEDAYLSRDPSVSAKTFAQGRPTSHFRKQQAVTEDYLDRLNTRLLARNGRMQDLSRATAAKSQVVPANEQDSLALVDLYMNTDGASWVDNSNWLDGPVSDWFGVILDEQGRVISIQLDQNNLAGQLPNSITTLSELQILSVYDNFLASTIPADIDQLQNLLVLDLGFNFLEGAIPVGMGSLPNLEALLLWGNQFSGPIPSELGNLTQLQELWLFLNDLSGEIPTALGDLSVLSILYLDQNQLTGSIPVEIGQLTNLVELFVDFNMLSGEIPDALASLVNLQILFLGDNAYGGEFPTFLTELQNLLVLYLGGAELTGNIPSEISNLTQLTALYLNNNLLTGPIPAALYDMFQLTRLDLSTNSLSGPISEDIGALENLIELNLSNNLFEGPMPTDIGILVILQELDLSGNMLSGEIPTLAIPQALRRVYLYNNQLSGALTDQFATAALLEELDVSDNALSGELPASLGSFVILKGLYLAGNDFSGALPEELGNLSMLQILTLFGNQFSGRIPEYLGDLPDLFILDLGGNQFEGPIPSNLGQPESLAIVFLDANHLTGALPDTFAGKESLFRLTIGSNEINQLPDLTSSMSLLILEIENNRLTFEDIIPLLGMELAGGFSYAPQKEIYPKIDDLGAMVRYDASLGGSGNAYQWYMNGDAIAGATGSVLELENTGKAAVMDTVWAEISNGQISDLILSTVPARTDAALTSISIVPDSVRVESGQRLQFVALGADQFDANRLFTTTWTATGGVIDSNGVYVAGETTGTFEITATNMSGSLSAAAVITIEKIDSPTATEPEQPAGDFALQASYPNPFSTRTNLEVRLATPAHVKLRVFDVLGREVMQVVDQYLQSGLHAFTLQAASWPSGVYFYTLEAGGTVTTRSMTKIN